MNGPLVSADESFLHQITETFASVVTSDRSWTEKAWAQACAHDGSAQLDIGLGIYPNRGVIDAYAGVSAGVRQWTVRANRALDLEIDTRVGPIAYEIVEPLRTLRFSLDSNDVVPVAFECEFTGVVPPFLEERELKRSADGRRIDSDIMRFHQPGVARGWLEIEGKRRDIGADWSAGRDRSWGVRYMIGSPERDLPRTPRQAGANYAIWSTTRGRAADAADFGLHFYYNATRSADSLRTEAQGGIEHPDGTKEHFIAVVPELTYHTDNRRLSGGRLIATASDGSSKTFIVEPVGDTGFHLGTGLYFSFDGRWHGQSRGPLEVSGEVIEDCSDPETARRIHQIRDAVVRISDDAGGVAYGSMQTILVGEFPELGLGPDSNFV